jgi:hypothetical protein
MRNYNCKSRCALFAVFKIVLIALFIETSVATAQQVPDLKYSPTISKPAFKEKEGPMVGIDEAHYNFHTATGRYQPFAKLLMRDGYRIARVKKTFSEEQLKHLKVLVIANPLHRRNNRNWKLPTPSAFSEEEIAAVNTWVKNGGSLFLMADHMPFPGGAGALAESFGFTFSNGYANPGKSGRGGPDLFKFGSGLENCAITQGRNEKEAVTSVATFTGSAFKPPEDAIQVLVFGKGSRSREPREAWKFSRGTPQVSIDGWCQGAIMEVGEGRVAIFGEAGMFTAQLAGNSQRRMGMSAPEAKQNFQLLLNLMHWLTKVPGMEE